LIFSVAESKAFQGFARMSCQARHDSQPINWVLPPGMSNRAFSGVIYIDWITRLVDIRREYDLLIILFLDEVYRLIKLYICSIHGMKINQSKLDVMDRYSQSWLYFVLYFYFLIFQEIEPHCAEALCRSFPIDQTIDIISIGKKAEKHRSSRSPLSINPSSLPSKDINHRSSNNIDRHRSDVTLYLIINHITNVALFFYTNHIQYRTFKKGVG
jgi:hypothetical protein